MNRRMAVVLFSASLLGGCSNSFWDDALRYPAQTSQSEPAPNTPEPVAPAAPTSAPFVAVPEAPPFSSPSETHRSLLAGTSMPPAPPPPSVIARAPAAAPLSVPDTSSEPPAPKVVEAPPPVERAPAPVVTARATPVVPAPPPAYTATAPAAPAPVATPPAAVQASETAADSWCVRVAKSAQAEAAEQGFDAATQERRALAVFKQCSTSPQAR